MTRRVGSTTGVLTSFVEGIPLDGIRTKSRCGESTLFIEGGVLYSYGYHYPMARWASRNVLLVNAEYWSATTNGHKTKLCWMVPDVLVCHVPNVKADSSDEHLYNLSEVSKNLISLALKTLRSRENKTWRRRELERSLIIRNDYADYLVAAGLISNKQGRPMKAIDCYMQL